MKPELSVVIPVYNAASTLRELLDALAGERWAGAWEVVVADNGSTDESLSIVEGYRGRVPDLKIVDASARRGQPFALNVGARAASGSAVVFCDADDVIAPGWVAATGEALREHAFVACRHEVARLNPEWLVGLRGDKQRDDFQTIWYPPYLKHAGGCGLGVWRRLLLDLGGFDEDLPYLHDTDLCFRLQRAGIEPYFVRGGTIHVRLRRDLRGTFRQAWLWAEFNDLLYRRYRQSGSRLPKAWRQYFQRWAWIFRLLPRARNPRARFRIAWQVGWQLGLLVGSLKFRVAPVVYPSWSAAPIDGSGVVDSRPPGLKAKAS